MEKVNTEELSLLELNDTSRNGQTRVSEPEVVVEVFSAPDGGWGWIVCFACFMVNVISIGLVFSSGILFVELLEYFNRSKAETSWIFALLFVISDVIAPLISALCNKFGCRIVCIAGSVLFAMGLIISAFVTNIYVLYFSLGVLIGFGKCMLYTTSIMSVSRYFEKRRAFATGIGVSGVGIGIFIFGPITKLLIDLYTWRGAILIEGALMLNCIPCGIVYLPVKEWKLRKSNAIKIKADNAKDVLANKLSVSVSDKNTQHTVCKPFKSCMIGLLDFGIFKHKGACVFFVHWFLASMAYLVPYIYIPDRAKEIGVTGYQGAWLISTIGITNTIGRVLFGFISDRKYINRLYIYTIAIIISGISTSLVPLLSSFEMLVAYSAVYGMCSGIMMALLTVIMADIVGIDRLMDTIGFSGFFAGFAQLIGSPGAGWLYDVTGGYNLTFILYGIILAVSGSILLVIPCHKKDDTMSNGAELKRQDNINKSKSK